MRYVDEFRDRKLIDAVAAEIRRETSAERRTYRFMEVCGTHTMNIFRFGLRDILPANIELVSGPGCPVCVTPNIYIDKAIALARREGVTIAAFGDMLRVPGSTSSLEREKARGAMVRMVYSTTDALEEARRHPDRQVVFLGVGFETTIPTVARAIIDAKRLGVPNFSVLCGHKTMPEVLRSLVSDPGLAIDGFLLPGHVSAITGSAPYRFLAARYGTGCVIAGFEPLDILQSILMLVRQRQRAGQKRAAAVEIQYTRIAGPGGNALARRSIAQVFRKVPSEWRGIGTVKDSGLAIRKGYAAFDAETRFSFRGMPKAREAKGCICGDVLKGKKKPTDCRLFGRGCTADHPVGACMVSSEGTCAAYYRFG